MRLMLVRNILSSLSKIIQSQILIYRDMILVNKKEIQNLNENLKEDTHTLTRKRTKERKKKENTLHLLDVINNYLSFNEYYYDIVMKKNYN